MTPRSLTRFFSADLAVDLGTANTLVYATGKGIVVNEPSIIVMNTSTSEVIAVGAEASMMLGRTPRDVIAIRPLRSGVIADFKAAEQLLTYFVQKAHNRKMMVHPRIVISIPSGSTEVEKRAVLDAAYRAKASEVYLVEQPLVAALGSGLPITEPSASMVIDIGGGTSDIGILSLAGVVYSRSIRLGGNQMDDTIIEHVKREHGLLIGERTAEAIKIELGSAAPLSTPATFPAKGRDLVSGLPKVVTVTDTEIRICLQECVQVIVNAVRAALERIPPELSGDLSERGMVLTGGGSMLKNLDKRLRDETGLPMCLAQDPLSSVVAGTARILSDFKLLRRVCLN